MSAPAPGRLPLLPLDAPPDEGPAPRGGAALEGELLSFQYKRDDGGFAVARVRPAQGPDQIAVGPIGHVPEGAHLRLHGRWTHHPHHGRQLQVERVLVDDPRTLEGLARYLGSGAVKGLGPAFARRVVDAFGLDTLRVIEEEPHRLREVPGIGEKRVDQIISHWEQDRGAREVHAALRGFGLGQALANRVVERFGRAAMGIVAKQPYRLAAEVRGVGFRTADAIARANGVAADDPARAEAALLHLLREAEGEGHCHLPQALLLERAGGLDVPADVARAALDGLCRRGELVRAPGAGDATVALRELDEAEALVAAELHRRAEAASAYSRGVPHVAGGDADPHLSDTLNGDQRAAVALALRAPVCVITGGPGTGKTTTVQSLIRATSARQERWALAAPTGRAARRLTEATGVEARTLHRLLELNPRTGAFSRDRSRPLEADGVLVDEASMVDLRLMASLLLALPEGCALVLVGDAHQLPSVGAGRVLGDLVDSGAVPVVTLREVYRQAAGSGIIRNAWRVHRGEPPVSGELDGTDDFFILPRPDPEAALAAVIEVVCRRLPRRGFDPLTDVQVLSPMHAGPLGTEALNTALQRALNPDGARLPRGEGSLRVGDRVVQRKNDYDNEIFNGETGRIVEVGDGKCTVDFDGRLLPLAGEQLQDLNLAWAMSVHKAQGSEYPALVLVLSRGHRMMLRRNLLYTAITRARRFCCIVGDPDALARAAQDGGGGERHTQLAQRLTLGAPSTG